MSWTRFAATVSAALLAGWATCASATDDQYGRSGPYLGAGGLYAFENFSGAEGSPSPDGAWGYELKGGYRFNEYFALEAAWEQYIGFDDSTGDTDIWMAGVNAKFFPLYGMIQPFVLAGAGWAGVDDNRAATTRDTNGLGFRFGGGLDLYLTRNWALTAEVGYILQISGRSDYGVIPLSFGVLYRFY